MKTKRHGDFGTSTVLGAAAVVAVAGAAAVAASRRRPRWRPDKRRPDMPTLAGGRGLRAEHAVTVLRSADELYGYWRDFSRLPELMPHVESVTPIGERRSRWVARGPAGLSLTWDAELVADEPGKLIAWRSAEGADVDNAGSVRFTPAPGGRGTEVAVKISYAPPAGRAGGAVASLLGRGGDREIRETLRRFKQRMETGEIAIGQSRSGPASGAPLARSA